MSSDGAKLVRAAATGNDAKVKRLLKAKVDVNSRSKNLSVSQNRVTALQTACGRGQLGVARLLLQAKAAVDLQNSTGGTALIYATEQNKPACAQLLLEALVLAADDDDEITFLDDEGEEEGRRETARERFVIARAINGRRRRRRRRAAATDSV